MVGVVPADDVAVDPAARGAPQQRLHGRLVALLGVPLQLRARGPEAGPAHQVSDQCDVFMCHVVPLRPQRLDRLTRCY